MAVVIVLRGMPGVFPLLLLLQQPPPQQQQLGGRAPSYLTLPCRQPSRQQVQQKEEVQEQALLQKAMVVVAVCWGGWRVRSNRVGFSRCSSTTRSNSKSQRPYRRLHQRLPLLLLQRRGGGKNRVLVLIWVEEEGEEQGGGQTKVMNGGEEEDGRERKEEGSGFCISWSRLRRS